MALVKQVDRYDLIWPQWVMKQVKIATLKANLSAYLAEVRKGESVIVCDRATPIARLVPFDEVDDLTIIDGIDPPGEARKIKPPKLRKPVDIDKYLLASRADK